MRDVLQAQIGYGMSASLVSPSRVPDEMTVKADLMRTFDSADNGMPCLASQQQRAYPYHGRDCGTHTRLCESRTEGVAGA